MRNGSTRRFRTRFIQLDNIDWEAKLPNSQPPSNEILLLVVLSKYYIYFQTANAYMSVLSSISYSMLFFCVVEKARLSDTRRINSYFSNIEFGPHSGYRWLLISSPVNTQIVQTHFGLFGGHT